MLSELLIQLFIILSAGLAGYGIRALQHPVQRRGKNGRFTKK